MDPRSLLIAIKLLISSGSLNHTAFVFPYITNCSCFLELDAWEQFSKALCSWSHETIVQNLARNMVSSVVKGTNLKLDGLWQILTF